MQKCFGVILESAKQGRDCKRLTSDPDVKNANAFSEGERSGFLALIHHSEANFGEVVINEAVPECFV